jgi:hypothetical protein
MEVEAFLLTGTVLQMKIVIVFIQVSFPKEIVVFSVSHL